MAWTDKARAASAASRRAKAGPKKLGAKAAAWRKAGDASNASRVSERGWGSGKGITKRGSLARRSNKERAKAVKSGATKKANTLIHRVIKGTPPSAVSPKRENYGNSFLQRQQDATYSKLAKNHANRSTMRLFNTGPYSINKNRLSNPVSGVAKGNAVTETGDATTSKAVRKSNRRTGKHPNTHLEDQQWAAKQYGGHPSDYGRNPKNGNLINSHRAFKLGKPKKRK